jgi:putative membrane protein
MKKSFLMIPTITIPAAIYAHGYYDWPYGYGHMGMMGWGMGGFVMWLVIIILIVILVYFLARSPRSILPAGRDEETPLQILKKRYAKGEITKEQYEQMKKDLEE